ncbi:hypothetical protein C0992_002799, partial [Termitomyces sp. T32_za158]
MDPNTGILRTVPTFPRGCHKQRRAKGPIFTGDNHGDEALILDYDHQTGSVHITATADLDPE